MNEKQALEEIQLIIPDVSREMLDKLSFYVQLLLKWNKSINLISKNTVDDLWTRHILDSAQLVKFIENKDLALVDIGTGAGLPGVILSILGVKNVTLVESDTKKCSFLLEISRILGLNLKIVNDRIENVKLNVDLLTARGLSSLNSMFYSTNKLGFSRMLLLKGEHVDLELAEAKIGWEFQCKKHNSITKSGSYILDIVDVQRKN